MSRSRQRALLRPIQAARRPRSRSSFPAGTRDIILKSRCNQSCFKNSQIRPSKIIVADGMSDDGTRELLARLAATESRLRVIDNPARIIPAGLNAAIRVARGRIIVRMDAHTEYAPDYLHHCVAVLSETGADNVGGPSIAEGKGLAGRAVAAAFRAPFAVGGAHGHDPNTEGRWIPSISDAGPLKPSTGLVFLTKSSSEAKTTN